MAQERTNRRASAVWSSAEFNSYDGRFSALSFAFTNGATMLQIAPIFAETIGKELKRGERRYDYDNKLNVSLDRNAQALKAALQYLTSDAEDIKSVTVGPITVFRPHQVSLNKETFDEYILRIEVERDEQKTRMYHVLQNHVFTVTKSDKTTEELVVESDIDMLMHACDVAMTNAMNLPRHAAAQVQGGKSGGGQRSSGLAQAVEEDDDEDPNASSPEKQASRKAASKALEEEFDDDDDNATPAKGGNVQDDDD